MILLRYYNFENHTVNNLTVILKLSFYYYKLWIKRCRILKFLCPMSSIIPDYEYDIFISYFQKDNKGDKWFSEFVDALKTELEPILYLCLT